MGNKHSGVASKWHGARLLIAVSMGLSALSSAHGAVFATLQENPNAIWIKGEVKHGDFARFKAFIEAQPKLDRYYDPHAAYLNSPGGDVAEALLFAEHFDRHFFTTLVANRSVCYSACTIMFAGGVERVLDDTGRLGFHRLSLRRNELDIKRARAETEPAGERVNAFFKKVGFPAVLVEKMNETPPSDIFLVDLEWISNQGIDRQLEYQPAYLDVVERQCGRNPLFPGAGRPPLSAYPKKAFEAWNDCSWRIRSKNLDISDADEWHQKQLSNKKKLDELMPGIKAMTWDLIDPSFKDSYFARRNAIRSGNAVAMWSLDNSIYKNKSISTMTKHVFNCVDRTQMVVAYVSCEGGMCEKPISYNDIDDPTVLGPSKLNPGSTAALGLAAACGGR